MSATWAQVHVGDTVRGADARAWAVVGRGRPRRFALAGDEATFALRLGEREVVVRRRLDDGAELVGRADHSAAESAAGVLLGAGLNVEIMEEKMGDPFTPAAVNTDVRHDRLGRYLLPDPQTGKERAWTRVSTIARTLADEYNLTLWKLRMVAKGLAIRPDLIAGAAAADPSVDKDDLNSIAKQAMDAAESKAGANFGTALHSFTRRLDAGEPVAGLRAPAPLDRDLAAYASLLKAERLTVQQSERVVIVPELDVAGRFDRIASGSILDLKSGKDLSYSWLEIAIQQACYAHGALMWDPATGAYEPMPPVDQDRALVLHLPVGRAHAQLYGVDIHKGWQYALLAMDVRGARSGARKLAWLVEPDDAVSVALRNVRAAGSREELAALWESLNKRGLWSEEVNDAAMARHAQLQAQSEFFNDCAEEATWK